MAESTYELWDTDTVNVIGDYPTKAAAFAYVRWIVSQYGREVVGAWELVCVPADGTAEIIAAGGSLADRADGRIPAQ